MMSNKTNNAANGVSPSSNAIIGYLIFNFISTILVTFINKLCFTRINFGFPAALCNIHFATTYAGVEIMKRLGMFEPLPKSPSIRADWHFASLIIFVGTVTPLNNTSLKLNSTAFYQLFKLLVTPAIVLLEYSLDGKVLSLKRAATLVAVVLFVLKSSEADLEFNMYGTICAIIWVPLAAGYKVQWGRVQRMHNCSTPALMQVVLPYAIVVQTIISPLVDPPGLSKYDWTAEAVFWIGLSGIAAFLVNLSGFLVMGHVGALAHVLLGQLKTSAVMLGAYYLFDAHYNFMQLLCAAGAVVSIVAYTHVTTGEKKNNKQRQDSSFTNEGNGDALRLPLSSKKAEKEGWGR